MTELLVYVFNYNLQSGRLQNVLIINYQRQFHSYLNLASFFFKENSKKIDLDIYWLLNERYRLINSFTKKSNQIFYDDVLIAFFNN